MHGSPVGLLVLALEGKHPSGDIPGHLTPIAAPVVAVARIIATRCSGAVVVIASAATAAAAAPAAAPAVVAAAAAAAAVSVAGTVAVPAAVGVTAAPAAAAPAPAPGVAVVASRVLRRLAAAPSGRVGGVLALRLGRFGGLGGRPMLPLLAVVFVPRQQQR